MADDGPWTKFQSPESSGPWQKFATQPEGTVTSGKVPQQDPMSTPQQIATGVGRGLAGYKQAASNIFSKPETAAKVNLAMQARDRQIAESGGLGVAGNVAEAVTQLPAAAAGGLVGTAVGGPAGGVIGGAR